jgi:hypothetical protein
VADRRSSRLVLLVGLGALVVSVVATAVLLVVAQRRYDDAVRGLARAPVGCDTTLEFTSTGTFDVFIETEGSIDQLVGGCEAPSSYLRTTERPPRVEIVMVGPTGDLLALDPTTRSAYEAEGFLGVAHRAVEVATTGNHLIRVSSPDTDFVVAVGRHPDDAALPAERGAVAVAVLGGLLAVSMLVWGALAGRTSRGDHQASAEPDGDRPSGQPMRGPEPPTPAAPTLNRPLGPPGMPAPHGVPLAPPAAPTSRRLPPPR